MEEWNELLFNYQTMYSAQEQNWYISKYHSTPGTCSCFWDLNQQPSSSQDQSLQTELL